MDIVDNYVFQALPEKIAEIMCSEAFHLAMLKEGISGEVFTIAGNSVTPLKDLILIVGGALGVQKPKIYIPSTPIVVLATVVEIVFNTIGKKPPIFRRSMDFFRKSVHFNPQKAQSLLGFQSSTPVHEGVKATADWYKEKDLI
jgi:nucleoside-diphosphate-sugar epimerase